MEKLLVTGITGRSGKIFGDILIKNRYKATALIRNELKFKKIFGEQDIIKHTICDIQDFNTIKDILIKNQIETIFHIVNIRYSVGIVKAAISSNCVTRIILVHTTGIYSKYKAAGREYLQIEEEIFNLLKNTNISLTILRPTMIYGYLDDANVSKFIKMIDKIRLFPLVKGGKYELQPVNYSDLGIAYYQVLLNAETTRNKNYTISGKNVIYLKDMLMSISDFLGKKTRFFSVPFCFAYLAAWVIYFLSFTLFDYREKVQRLVEPRAYAHDEAIKDFNYSPMDFWDGLKREVELYRNKKS